MIIYQPTESHLELKLPSYKGQSPQLSLRRYFADLIAIVSNCFTLCPSARHLAICWTYLWIDMTSLPSTCIYKSEEKEDSVPKLEQLNSLGCMTNMNLWNLCLPTAAHFMEYYLSEAVHETDLHDGWPIIYYAFLNYAPSLVAAACVASSRIILRLSPTWPTRLHRLTAYSWDFFKANKQRGQAGSQPAQLSVLQSASQPSWLVHFQQPHYLHQIHHTSLQYCHPVAEQPSCQQIGSTTHTSSYTLQTCPSGFQTSVQGLGHVQTGVGMSLAIPVEVKPCLNVSFKPELSDK
ncbi:unnamed protein product [Nyctereutes procyonoides]|uniref:(raccoon dog) hypothetical protein n=1 Tax=Nyctereutes procyonoides TaxID=34880 RepID=A0A811YY05_NYCPR|nr:unnamed protein product [Nyctereutes procyonoides]